jgi:hypothetical protein
VSVDSVLNICGFDLDRTLETTPDFLEGKAQFKHDRSVSSFSLVLPGDVDMDSVQAWMQDLLQAHGDNIYRMKGLLAVSNEAQKFVYQGVHMALNAEFIDEVWGPGEARESKLVFIGKNLDKEALREGFTACVMTSELIERKRGMLRFAIGDKVECISANGWQTGEVVAQMYNDEKMPPYVVAPYQVRMEESGRLFCLLRDSDDVIRKQTWSPLRKMSEMVFPQRRSFSSARAAFQAPLRTGGVSTPVWSQPRPSWHSFSRIPRSLRRLK